MTRKDYIAIAEALKYAMNWPVSERFRLASGIWPTAIAQAAQCIGDALHKDNPRFDREHFLAVVRGERDLNSQPTRRAQ